MTSPAERLRAMLKEEDKIVVCPGVYDGLTARIALNTGFECLYMASHQRPKARAIWLSIQYYRLALELQCQDWECQILGSLH